MTDSAAPKCPRCDYPVIGVEKRLGQPTIYRHAGGVHEKPSCRHEWQPCDFHVCNVVPVEGKKHAHYVWSVCAKCGEGSILR